MELAVLGAETADHDSSSAVSFGSLAHQEFGRSSFSAGTAMDVDLASPRARSAAQLMSSLSRSMSMPVDIDGNGVGRVGAGGVGGGSHGMELDEYFGIEVAGAVGGGQPPVGARGPSGVNSGAVPSSVDDQDMFGSSLGGHGQYPVGQEQDSDMLHLYLPTSLSKPFGSLSDIQTLALDHDYGLRHTDAATLYTSDRTTSDMDVSRSQGNIPHPSFAQPPVPATADPFGIYRSPDRIERSGRFCSSGSSFNTSGERRASLVSSSSYLPTSLELVPSSLSPMMLHYDMQGRLLVDTSGNTTGGNATSDGLSFVLSGLADSSLGSGLSADGAERKGSSSRRVETSIIPTTLMRDLGNPSAAAGAGGNEWRRANERDSGEAARYTSVSMPLPIPARSKQPTLLGWQGECQDHGKDHISIPGDQEGGRASATEEKPLESRKRKRSAGADSDDEATDWRKDTLNSQQFREEQSTAGGPERKKRRVGSLNVIKGKERDTRQDWEGSGRDSDSSDDEYGDDDDDDDVYYPSRSPSPVSYDEWREPGPSSRFVGRPLAKIDSESGSDGNRHRSESTQTLLTTSTDIAGPSSRRGRNNGRVSGKQRRNKGKAKGSAALALAKITMMSGKSPTSPWGTYAPYPFYEEEVVDGEDDEPQIKAGRKRKNGHIPLPVPVPHLIKKSRGRKVPFAVEDVADGSSGSGSSSRKRGGEGGKRMYVCEVLGCGKGFVRGEHLKRHVRSIHTNDKPHPCPFEGCDKAFSRRDNLGQHVRIHLPSNS